MRRVPRLVAGVLLIPAGCASSPGDDPSAGGPVPSAPGIRGRAVIRQLVNTDNGLELQKWLVANDPQTIGRALQKYQAGDVIDEAAVRTLRRDGLRLVRVPKDQLKDLLGELGPASVQIAWHGQILEWRELQHQPIPQGAVVAAGGRAHRLEPGRVRLLARCWTIQMEDGPYLNLEVVVEFKRPSGPRLQRLLGARGLEGRVFATTGVELLMEDDFAYVVTGESPGVETDVFGSLGPDATAPRTLGEELLTTTGEPPMRAMIVFVPRIPQRLRQPYEVTGGE